MEKWNAEPVELQSADEHQLQKLAANKSEDYRLINLWSISCGPCIAELPELVAVHRMYRGRNFQMYTVTIDPLEVREPAEKILQQNHVSCTNYIFRGDDRDRLAEAIDPQWAGPVPLTLLIAPGGSIVRRWTDSFDPAELKAEIVEHLGRTYANRK